MIGALLSTVRRKPLPAAAVDITATYIGRTSDTTDSTAYTWADHSIGTEDPTRVVVVSIHGRAAANRTVSSVVVGGVAVPAEALVQTSASQHPAAIAFASVPAGTTANIQVTFSGAMVRASIAVTTLTGPAGVELLGSASSTNSSAMVVAAVDGGAIVASGSTGFGGGSCSWSGVTEDFDVTIESASMHSGGHAAIVATGDVTVTPTWSATTNTPRNIVASFGPTGGDPAPVVTRQAYLWPFAIDAAFNVPISSAATYESSVSPKTATCLGMFPTLGQVNGGAGGFSIQPALGTTSDPLATVTHPTTGAVYGTWRIPATMTPPTGTDKSCSVVQPDGTVVDFYKMVKVSDTHWTSTSVEWQAITGDGISAGVRASDLCNLNGLIRSWEINAVLGGDTRLCRHALAVAIPKESLGGTSPYYVEPASAIDNQTNVPYQLKNQAGGIEMGSFFAIPDSTVLTSIPGLSATWGLPLARTLQEYGAYITDQSVCAAIFVEPNVSSTICDAIKADWKILAQYCRRVSSTNTVGAWGGGSAPRLASDAPALAGASASSAPTPSGFTMPTGAVDTAYGHYTLVHATNFDGTVAEGGFSATAGGTGLAPWPTTTNGDNNYLFTYPSTFNDTSGNGQYNANKTMSLSGSVLKVRMHTESSQVYVGAPVLTPTVGDPWTGQTYGRYSVAMRHQHISGTWDHRYKIAFLLWPDSDLWPDDGEIDYPEAGLEPNSYAGAFAHYASSGGGQDSFLVPSSTLIDEWHVYTIEWSPGRIEFFVDGSSIGASTTLVTSKSMHWVLQCETHTSAAPDASSVDTIEIDWAALWSWSAP